MSLETKIFLMEKTDIKELFDFCNGLLGAENPKFKATRSAAEGEFGYLTYRNDIDQGLKAALMVQTHEARDVNPEDYFDDLYEEDYEDCDDPEPTLLEPACAMLVTFDTTFGYRDEFGGANNLHGRYIIALHDWLASKNIRIKWREEYTREIHDGLDNIDRMVKNNSDVVFYNRVFLPAVAAHMSASQH